MSLEKNYIHEGVAEGMGLPSGQDNALSNKIRQLEDSLRSMGNADTSLDEALSKLEQNKQGSLEDSKETGKIRLSALLQKAQEGFQNKMQEVQTNVQKTHIDNMQTVKTRITPLSGVVASPEEAERNAHMQESLHAFFRNNSAELSALEHPNQNA